MENSIGYSIGVVERFLEMSAAEDVSGAIEVLEHFHYLERNIKDLMNQIHTQKTQLADIQQSLNGWTKI
jgi:hypothetical protein